MGPRHLCPVQLLCLLGAISTLPRMSCGAGCLGTLLVVGGGGWVDVTGGRTAWCLGSWGDRIYGG